MTLLDLQEKMVAVLGFGVEGRAILSYLRKYGITPTLFDHKPWDQWSLDDQNKIKSLGVNFIFGPDCLKELKGFDVAFRSPGLWRLNPDLLVAEKKGLKVTSQTKFFFDNCPAKIIGVTGTKGKGTTSALIYAMLRATNYKLPTTTYLTGNIGKTQPLEILDNLGPEDRVVYELSSFQLQDLTKSPHIGVVLMVTQEHLDIHEDANEYIEAKSAITKFQSAGDFAIVNADYKASEQIGKLGSGKKLFFSKKLQDLDCFVQNSEIIAPNFKFKLPVVNLRLRGMHNWENIEAASLAALCAGADADTVRKSASEFKGLQHRLEFVAEKNGIKFYNDSFSTTPETAIAAIQAFTEPEILILGGSSKNSDFSELGEIISQSKNIKAAVLIGEEAPKIRKLIDNPNIQLLEGAKNMAEVFNQVRSIATSGDVVVLSPACASFDMFSSYVDRGLQFKKMVEEFQ